MIDIQRREARYRQTLALLRRAPIRERNRQLIEAFHDACVRHRTCGPDQHVQNIATLLGFARALSRDFDRLTREDVARLVALNDARAPWTRAKRSAILRRFLAYLHDPDGFPKSSIPPHVVWIPPGLRRSEKPRLARHELLTPEEVERAGRTCGSRDRALLGILWETGARIAEIGNLERGHVTPTREGYYLDVQGKTGRRTLLIVRSAPALARWLRHHPKDDPDAGIWWGRNRPLQYTMLRRIIKTAFRRAGVTKRVYPHLLRHSRATHVLAGGIMTESQAKRFFGWTPDSDMLATYVHLTDQDANSAILRESAGQWTTRGTLAFAAFVRRLRALSSALFRR